MGFGGSGGGSGSVAGSSDVALNNPADSQVLSYNASTSKWKNATITQGGGATAGFVYYTTASSSWPSRPVSATPVMWVSTTDSTALQPTDMVIGDMWVRHPDALEAE